MSADDFSKWMNNHIASGNCSNNYDCIKSNEIIDQENTSSEPKKIDKKVLIDLCSAHVMKSFTNRLA